MSTIAALVCRSTCKDIFVCDEESHFYSQCLVKLVLKDCDKREEVLSNPTHVAVFGVQHSARDHAGKPRSVRCWLCYATPLHEPQTIPVPRHVLQDGITCRS